MRVLITGAYGFVGSNVSAYLAKRGYELWALDIAENKVSRQDAKTPRGGGTNAQRPTPNVQRSSFGRGSYVRYYGWEELERIPWGEVDAVIHLAGKAHDTRNTSDPQSYFDINVGLTKTVLEKFSRQNAKTQRKFIFFSSVKAVADRVEGVLDEDAIPDPKTPYGQSKLEAEKVVRRAFMRYCGSVLVGEKALTETPSAQRKDAVGYEQSARNHDSTHERMNARTDELCYYILRPCMIHGPGNKGNLNLLYGVVRKGVPWPLGAFENRRSFTSIDNLCAVVEALIKDDVPSGIYQMADDEPLSTNELIKLMAESLGRRAKTWRIPAGWVQAVARSGDVLRLPLNSERLKKLTESYVASNAKIKAALGWKRMPVRAEEGMRKTLESFGNRQQAMGNRRQVVNTIDGRGR